MRHRWAEYSSGGGPADFTRHAPRILNPQTANQPARPYPRFIGTKLNASSRGALIAIRDSRGLVFPSERTSRCRMRAWPNRKCRVMLPSCVVIGDAAEGKTVVPALFPQMAVLFAPSKINEPEYLYRFASKQRLMFQGAYASFSLGQMGFCLRRRRRAS